MKKERKKLDARPGQLPIFRNIVERGQTWRRRLDSGDELTCKKCGKKFPLTDECSWKDENGNPFILCPWCFKYVAAVEYMR